MITREVLTKLTLRALMVMGFLYLIHPVLVPLILGAVFAAVVLPLQKKNWRALNYKYVKATLISLGVALALFGPLLGLTYSGASMLRKRLREGWPQLTKLLEKSDYLREAKDFTASVQELIDRIQQFLVQTLEKIITAAPEFLVGIGLMFLSLVWFLTHTKEIFNWTSKTLGLSRTTVEALAESFHAASRSVIVAGLLSGVAQAIIIGAGVYISGAANPKITIPAAFFASFLPVFGVGAVNIVILMVALVQNEMRQALTFLPFAAISGLADNIVYSLVVGKSGELNPFISLLAVLGGIELFGFFGIFIGPIAVIMAMRIFDLFDNGAGEHES